MSPIERALYMLELRGIDYESEARRIHESDNDRQKILIDILELNEMIDDIQTRDQVIELEKKLIELIKPYKYELDEAFNSNKFENAIRVLSKIKYYENIDERLKELKLKFSLTNSN